MTYLLDQIWLVFCWEHHWESLLSPHHHFDGERWSAWESPPSPAVLHMHLHHSYSQNERSVCKTTGEGNTERNQLHVYIAEFVFYKKKLFWNSFLGHLWNCQKLEGGMTMRQNTIKFVLTRWGFSNDPKSIFGGVTFGCMRVITVFYCDVIHYLLD